MSPTSTSQRIRVVVAKPGLDGHDRGAKIIARATQEAVDFIRTSVAHSPSARNRTPATP